MIFVPLDLPGQPAEGVRVLPRSAEQPIEVDRHVADLVEIVVQVNGKLRARLTVPADLSDEELREHALAHDTVQAHTQGKTIRKVVVAKGPLVSLVVS